ncbi:MAG: hypothetical protein KF852_17010 [Saprospiraceae bacterium]|nr:hypothetical protein [Saprospiraceae bacterium]
MKTKLFFFSALAALFALIVLPSCEKDHLRPEIPHMPVAASEAPEQPAPTLPETVLSDSELPVILAQLPGFWNVLSFQVNGAEYISTFVKSASFRFYPAPLGAGEFRQEVHFADGETDIVAGTYRVDEGAQQIILTSADESIVANISITDGNQMRWEFTQDWMHVVVKAVKL